MNVAYRKIATQSGGINSNHNPAGRALDGNISPVMKDGHCAHPDGPAGSKAWWEVDLAEIYIIHRVIIYNRKRGECCFKICSVDKRPVSYFTSTLVCVCVCVCVCVRVCVCACVRVCVCACLL